MWIELSRVDYSICYQTSRNTKRTIKKQNDDDDVIQIRKNMNNNNKTTRRLRVFEENYNKFISFIYSVWMIMSLVTLFNEMLTKHSNAIGSIVAPILTQSQFYLIKLSIFNMALKDKAFRF